MATSSSGLTLDQRIAAVWADTKDDAPHVLAAMREWNFKQPAWKPFLKFSDIPAAEQGRVLVRAWQIAHPDKVERTN